jgi:hypothetical protein
MTKREVAVHVSAIIRALTTFNFWTLSLQAKLLLRGGIRKRVAMGLAIPTATELRTLAEFYREQNYVTLLESVYAFMSHVTALTGKGEVPAFDPAAAKCLNEVFAKTFEFTADELEKINRPGIIAYGEAIHRVSLSPSYMTFMAQAMSPFEA